jgi:hypothetical protein
MTKSFEETIKEMWETNRGISEDIFTLPEFIKVIDDEISLSRKEERERINKTIRYECEKMYPEFLERNCNDLLVNLTDKLLLSPDIIQKITNE